MRTCISVRTSFIAGHRVPEALSAKCSKIHGHNYAVKVRVCRDGEIPWVMDLDELHKAVEKLLEPLDHSYILAENQEEIVGAKNIRLPIKIASAEEISRWIYESLIKIGIKGVAEVEVCETSDYCASYGE
ncbi:MAG: 6-carboxytetrahydropterin synthase [Desulfurococcales archaeon]|jgi:6-pyruvoyl tetrahydropterin synthase/QueD family protein|nr:6-carboxytetrahydropterin synthase [Desulfurococcales archaeon]